MKIQDIARLSGVSISTVSRVINNYDNVPEKTKEKVMKVIKKHNYIPNSTARILTGKKNKTLGLFIVEITDSHFNNIILPSAWFTDIIAAVVSYASEKNYKTLVTLINTKKDLKKIKDMFMNKTICGGIFIGVENTVKELDELDELGYKLAILEQNIPENVNKKNTIYVNTDNFKGAYEATKHLIENGHRRIVHLMGNKKKSPTLDRFNGYKKALEDHNIPIDKNLIIEGEYQRDIAYKNIQKLLNKKLSFSAIFAASDDMAFGAIKALKENGLKVPSDVSIIGYDDTIIAKLSDFSSVKAHGDVMADLLVNQIISCVEKQNKVPNKYIIESKLEIRNSIKTINRRKDEK